MKRLFAILIVIILPLGLAACDGENRPPPPPPPNTVYAIYGVHPDETNLENLDNRLANTAESIQSMLRNLGYPGAAVTAIANQRIRAEVPDTDDAAELLRIIGESVTIYFQIEGVTYVRGRDIVNAYTVNVGGNYAVQIELNAQGTQDLLEATNDNIGKVISIIAEHNGVWQTISAPVIQAAIPNGRPMIVGNFTYEEAGRLAKQILAGAFSVKLELLETNLTE